MFQSVKVVLLILLLSVATQDSLALQSFLQETAFPRLSFIQNAFGGGSNKVSLDKKRNELKLRLLEECGKNTVDRGVVEELISELRTVSPTPNSASDPALNRKWLLQWTSEKEINFFIDFKLCTEIYQIIDGNLLENMIPFKNGGYFGVKGYLSREPNGVRTYFEFSEATLDIGRWGMFQIPPIGKGWFDTVYLDGDMRVDTNSRNDILICRSK
jgi:PAP_fibrillin